MRGRWKERVHHGERFAAGFDLEAGGDQEDGAAFAAFRELRDEGSELAEEADGESTVEFGDLTGSLCGAVQAGGAFGKEQMVGGMVAG